MLYTHHPCRNVVWKSALVVAVNEHAVQVFNSSPHSELIHLLCLVWFPVASYRSIFYLLYLHLTTCIFNPAAEEAAHVVLELLWKGSRFFAPRVPAALLEWFSIKSEEPHLSSFLTSHFFGFAVHTLSFLSFEIRFRQDRLFLFSGGDLHLTIF